MNTCLCFPTCKISSGFADMLLTPIRKHREHSSLFPFLQGETLAPIIERTQKAVPGVLTCRRDKSKPRTRVRYLQVFFVCT